MVAGSGIGSSLDGRPGENPRSLNPSSYKTSFNVTPPLPFTSCCHVAKAPGVVSKCIVVNPGPLNAVVARNVPVVMSPPVTSNV